MAITVSQNTERQQEALRRVESYLGATAKPRVTYGPDGAVIGVEEMDGKQSAYTYSAHADLTGIREADGSETRYEYQARRLTRVIFPDGGETRYDYDASGRLSTLSERGQITRYAYDSQGRWTEALHADGAATRYDYDAQGRITEAVATPPTQAAQEQAGFCDQPVTTRHEYDEQGQTTAIHQEMGGVRTSVRLRFDASRRLSEMDLPGLSAPIRYTWDEKGRPLTICLETESLTVPFSLFPFPSPSLARFEFEDATRTTRTHLANGWTEETQADAVDCRPVSRRVWHTERAGEPLLSRINTYDAQGRIIADGANCYDYDAAGRLSAAHAVQEESSRTYEYDAADCLRPENANGSVFAPAYDARGCQIERRDERGTWTYAYDEAHNLRHVTLNGVHIAAFAYDHKGRLAAAQMGERVERYAYGPADELLAVVDAAGHLLRAYIRTPLGLLAQIDDAGRILFAHCDDRGTCLALTDAAGDVVERFAFDAYGAPEEDSKKEKAVFCGKPYFAEIGLYRWGARWYDPQGGQFLTRDTYTGAPDDARLVHPCMPPGEQAKMRAQILMDWLKQPRVRRAYAFCHGDPINHSDPNGHWALGGALLSLLGAVWSLPNTLLGLLLEITCLVGEVLRWLVFVMSGGKTTWQTPGVEGIVTSPRLNTIALVFSGGWIGSLPDMTALTFGNVIFVNKDWKTNPALDPAGDVKPPAYNGTVTIPGDQALYEREMRKGNQYGWFGPFYHLGVPTFGLYLWDLLLNEPDKSWLAQDAHQYGGV